MHPTAKIGAVIAAAALAVVGAGLALSSVGGEGATAQAAAPANNLAGMTRHLKRLDSRSHGLEDLLARLQHTSQRLDRRSAELSSQAIADSAPVDTAPSYSPPPPSSDDAGVASDQSSANDDGNFYDDDDDGDGRDDDDDNGDDDEGGEHDDD